MKWMVWFVAAVVTPGCVAGGGDGDVDHNRRVSVVGNLRADAAAREIALASAPAAVGDPVDSVYSTLRGVVVSGRFSPITAGDLVVVETTVTNESDVAADVVVSVEIESATFATPEQWSCNKCYAHPTGEYCNSLWMVNGGTVVTPMDPPPALGVCDATTPETGGFCIDNIPDDANCSSPTWRVSYEPPGSGLWWGETTASIAAGDSWNWSVGYGASDMDARPDHYARWVVRDQATGEVLAGGQKDYAFDVVDP